METVYLQGTEAVSRAGHQFAAAAEQMSRTADSYAYTMEQHRRFMDEWLSRLEAMLTTKTEERP